MFVTKFPIDVIETMFNLTTPLTNPSQYVTFYIQNYVWEHWFDQHEGLWCVFTVKRRPLRNFLTYRNVSAFKFSH